MLYTVVDQKLARQIDERCAAMGLPCVSVLEPVLTVFQSYLGTPAGRRVGAQHVLDAEYFRRIDALNFTMEHDDGQLPDDIDEADIVLIGISRTSKTPTSIYLANRGIKTANIPIVLGVPVPESLIEARRPLIVGLIATAERISQVRQNRVLGSDGRLRRDRLCRPRDDRRGTDLCAADLHAAWLADDRCQPPLDRGDRGGDRCPARQGALERAGNDLRDGAMAEDDHPCFEQPVPQGAARTMPGSTSLRCRQPISTSGRSRRRWRAAASTPEDVALVLAEAKAADVSESTSRRAGARLRPDAVARRRDLSQAGGHGRRAPPSACPVRQDASAEQRRGAGARRRDAVAACRHRQPDDAQARAGLHRPPSGAGRRQGAVRASAPTRSKGEGIQLFEKIEGDYFTIVGLPLLAAAGRAARSRGDRWLSRTRRPSSAAIRSRIRARR